MFNFTTNIYNYFTQTNNNNNNNNKETKRISDQLKKNAEKVNENLNKINNSYENSDPWNRMVSYPKKK